MTPNPSLVLEMMAVATLTVTHTTYIPIAAVYMSGGVFKPTYSIRVLPNKTIEAEREREGGWEKVYNLIKYVIDSCISTWSK